jgi:hypothetical protein
VRDGKAIAESESEKSIMLAGVHPAPAESDLQHVEWEMSVLELLGRRLPRGATVLDLVAAVAA